MKPTDGRVVSLDELLDEAAAARSQGKKIAFANGCFDLIHVGHVRYLQAAAEVADILVVGINADESVRRLKGEGRPLIDERERAEIISAIRGVDFVTVFSSESPRELIAALRPDFQCKGTDYTEDSVPEGDVVRSYGGRVVIVGDPKDHSTSEILERMGKSGS
jgi:rfaE bifunctional protein nucleotidyltransferase chain/domain